MIRRLYEKNYFNHSAALIRIFNREKKWKIVSLTFFCENLTLQKLEIS